MWLPTIPWPRQGRRDAGVWGGGEGAPGTQGGEDVLFPAAGEGRAGEARETPRFPAQAPGNSGAAPGLRGGP